MSKWCVCEVAPGPHLLSVDWHVDHPQNCCCETRGDVLVRALRVAGSNLTELRWRNVFPGLQFDDIRVNSIAEPGPPVRLILRPINSIFSFDMEHLRVGKYYTVERSADLVNWQPLGTNYARSPSQVAGYWPWQTERNFYRVRYEE